MSDNISVLTLRMNAVEHRAVKEAAEAAGKSINAFCRDILMDAAIDALVRESAAEPEVAE